MVRLRTERGGVSAAVRDLSAAGYCKDCGPNCAGMRVEPTFSAVTMGLVPVIFALVYRPAADPNSSAPLEIADQLKWALIGILMSVLLLGRVVGRLIPRVTPRP